MPDEQFVRNQLYVLVYGPDPRDPETLAAAALIALQNFLLLSKRSRATIPVGNLKVGGSMHEMVAFINFSWR
jgi:hypothetical protein